MGASLVETRRRRWAIAQLEVGRRRDRRSPFRNGVLGAPESHIEHLNTKRIDSPKD